jgi:hypothetical protein
MKKRTHYWVRLGDVSDYHCFDELDELADMMVEHRVFPTLRRAGQSYGLINDNFQGNNYVSCYLGDAAANAGRPLSDPELKRLNTMLRNKAATLAKELLGKVRARAESCPEKHLSTNEARAKAEQAKLARFGLMVPLWADDIYLRVHGLGTGKRQITISGKVNAEQEIWTDNSDNRWRKLG